MEQLPGREHTLTLLAQAVFTLLLRNAKLDDHAASGMRGELKLFQRFHMLIESHFHQHWTVPDYATHGHLPSLCQPSAKTVDFRQAAARSQAAAAVF